MATELESIRIFLGKVHTAATVKYNPVEAAKVSDIVDATYQKILVYPPEIMGFNGNFIIKRYKVEVSETSEANLTTAINNIMIGIDKFNRRQTITGWTYTDYPTLCHIRLARGSIIEITSSNSRADCTLWMDIEWSVS